MLFRFILLPVIFLLLIQLSLSDNDGNGGNENQNNGDQPPDQNDQNNDNGNDPNAKYDCQFDGVGGFIKCPFQKIRYFGHLMKEGFYKVCPVCEQPWRTGFDPAGNMKKMMGDNDPEKNIEDSGFDPKGNFEKETQNGGDQNNGQ